jgi:DNA-binding LacI/PurR family transcriptional regulator
VGRQKKSRAGNRGTSLKQVSELAGVTQSTACRILNRNSDYSYAEETVRRVFRVAREQGYRTNQIYRSVFTGKTRSAGVVTSVGGFYSEAVRGIHDRLLESGYAVVMGINVRNYDDRVASEEEAIIRRLNEHRVDGFILRPTRDDATDEHFREIIDARVPLITIDREVNSQYADYVGSDNVAGGRIAAGHLADLGHTSVVQFAGNQQCSAYRERASGFETEMIERGCNVQTATCRGVDEVRQKCGLLFKRRDRPTAAFCAQDSYAAAVYEVLLTMGLGIPEDVSVIGFGDDMLGEHLRPKLTTIDQHPYRIGVKAAELFLSRVDGPSDKKRRRHAVIVDVDLVERDSCRAAG